MARRRAGRDEGQKPVAGRCRRGTIPVRHARLPALDWGGIAKW